MKVMYDHQAFTIQRYGGISRYFFHLIQEIKRNEWMDLCLNLRLSNNDYVSFLKDKNIKRFFPDFEFKGKYQFMRLVNVYHTSKKLNKSTFDLFHPTYYDNYFLKVLDKKKPFVMTVYDLIHEKYAGIYPQLNKEKETLKNKHELLQRARRVIAISNSTKQDLMDIYNIEPGKIDVIHLSSSFTADNNINYNKSDYILFVGNRSLYKNFKFFLEVAAGFMIKYNLKLICAGGAVFSEEEVAQINRLGIKDRVKYYKIHHDDELKTMYKNALLFTFPSLYEGFGIPILEALQLGCPAIVSNTSSFPEVGRDAVIYFDPTDKASLSSSLDKVISDENLRKRMIDRGVVRSKEFSWYKCASETISVYHASV